jgi:hypothetical protein
MTYSRRVRGAGALLIVLGAALFPALWLAAAPRERRAENGSDRVLAELRSKIREKPASIASVLRSYNTIEKRKKLDERERYRLHEGLLEELRRVEHVALAKAATSFLKRSSSSTFPAQVLLIKAVVSPTFPADRTARIALLVDTVRRAKNPRVVVWSIRMLAESKWPEAIDALITMLEGEEKGGRFFNALYHGVKSELFRVLGGEVSQAGSQKIRQIWEASGKRPPEMPEYGAGATQRTVAFFGDRVVPGSVFCIDASGSMAEAIRLRSPAATARTGVRDPDKIDTTPKEPKLAIVKRELSSALKGLHPSWGFNLARYSDGVSFWKPGKRGVRAELANAKEKSVKAAVEFTQELVAEGATNIHDTLVEALSIPEVDTIYLLSDGEPTRGGGMRAIANSVAAMNYLRGVRIITYGFGAEQRFQLRKRRGRVASRHEDFMKRLALLNWGWYRRLN